MTIAAAYNVIMASITLFMFTSWFKGQAYDLLEHNGLLKTDYSAVDNASTVVGIYALLVLIIGIVSFIMALFADSRGLPCGVSLPAPPAGG